MAGLYGQIDLDLPDKSEVHAIIDATDAPLNATIGSLVLLWLWVDKEWEAARKDGITVKTLCRRFGGDEAFWKAVEDQQWIVIGDGYIEVIGFEKRFSKSARSRRSDAKRQADWREKQRDTSHDLVTDECDKVVTPPLPKREEEREGNHSSKGDRRAIGSAESPSRQRGDQSSRSSRSPKEFSSGQKADLSDVDWSHVVAIAESAARKVPVRSDEDRRDWLRFGVLAVRTFGESWVADAAEAVVKAKETKRTKQAHFVGVLRSKAAEQGINSTVFRSMMRAIEIPNAVWKSGVLET